MERIYKLGQRYGFKIIEDASHAIGGRYKGLPIGNCQFSEIAIFSFHPVKIVTTGEGGMITTNSFDLYKKLLRLRSHGINKLDDEFQFKLNSTTDGVVNPWYYEMQDLGYNYRITDFQAALGSSQLARADVGLARRRPLRLDAGRYAALGDVWARGGVARGVTEARAGLDSLIRLHYY
jgi:dTDP-4-amino-4,6-dideoxygalactose transaminase